MIYTNKMEIFNTKIRFATKIIKNKGNYIHIYVI